VAIPLKNRQVYHLVVVVVVIQLRNHQVYHLVAVVVVVIQLRNRQVYHLVVAVIPNHLMMRKKALLLHHLLQVKY